MEEYCAQCLHAGVLSHAPHAEVGRKLQCHLPDVPNLIMCHLHSTKEGVGGLALVTYKTPAAHQAQGSACVGQPRWWSCLASTALPTLPCRGAQAHSPPPPTAGSRNSGWPCARRWVWGRPQRGRGACSRPRHRSCRRMPPGTLLGGGRWSVWVGVRVVLEVGPAWRRCQSWGRLLDSTQCGWRAHSASCTHQSAGCNFRHSQKGTQVPRTCVSQEPAEAGRKGRTSQRSPTHQAGAQGETRQGRQRCSMVQATKLRAGQG